MKKRKIKWVLLCVAIGAGICILYQKTSITYIRSILNKQRPILLTAVSHPDDAGIEIKENGVYYYNLFNNEYKKLIDIPLQSCSYNTRKDKLIGVSINPSGETIGDIMVYDFTTQELVESVSLEEMGAEKKTGVHKAAFIPNSENYSVLYDNQICEYDKYANKVQTIYGGEEEPIIENFFWDAQGTHLYLEENSNLVVYNLDTNEKEIVLLDVATSAISDDKSKIAFLSNNDSKVYIYYMGSKEKLFVKKIHHGTTEIAFSSNNQIFMFTDKNNNVLTERSKKSIYIYDEEKKIVRKVKTWGYKDADQIWDINW